MAKRNKLAVEPISSRAGFVAEVQPRMLARELADEPLHGSRGRVNLTDIPHLAAASALCNCDCMLGLRGIDTDVNHAILVHGPPSFAWGSARHPSNPRLLTLQRLRAGRPTDHGHNV